MKSQISTKFDTAKDSVAVFILCGGKILLKRHKYEGVWCCEAFLGKFIKPGENPIEELVQIENDRLGIDLTPKNICTIVSYINKPKPDGRVRLTSMIYLLEISEDVKSQIKKDESLIWMSTDEVNNSKEIRQDDKLIFTRILGGNYKNLTMDVDQMGKWGRPHLLAWFED